MASQYAGDPARRKAARDLMEKLHPLSDDGGMDMMKDIQKNYRLPVGKIIKENIKYDFMVPRYRTERMDEAVGSCWRRCFLGGRISVS